MGLEFRDLMFQEKFLIVNHLKQVKALYFTKLKNKTFLTSPLWFTATRISQDIIICQDMMTGCSCITKINILRL
jgi:hypothetical protein